MINKYERERDLVCYMAYVFFGGNYNLPMYIFF